ncbi:hypothetical protein DFH06DRAFT_560175 [Mycena polygramma]|nr:hypothetical protein DFH06DRAFT_560175 [Mycena polygramma]
MWSLAPSLRSRAALYVRRTLQGWCARLSTYRLLATLNAWIPACVTYYIYPRAGLWTSLHLTQVSLPSMFDHCSNFIITESTFNAWEKPKSDFRQIPAGDLNLLVQVGSDEFIEADVIDEQETGNVTPRKSVVGTRKLYRARIFGNQDPMTVIAYEGSEFSKWMREAKKRRIPRSPAVWGNGVGKHKCSDLSR